VLKPLSPTRREKVFYLRRRQVKNLNQIIAAVTKDGYAVAQEYLPEAEQGEKRLLLPGAAPHPPRGPGGHLPPGARPCAGPPIRRPSPPRPRHPQEVRLSGRTEARLCEILRPKLLADGLYLVSVDIVGRQDPRAERLHPRAASTRCARSTAWTWPSW
jgi:glutathione synthase